MHRRKFLTHAAACAVAPAALWSSVELPAAAAVVSPDDALRELVAGNARYAANALSSVKADLPSLREHTAVKQQPFAAVLACADSRVPVELVFDQSIGGVFVTRVAGNIATPEIIASLEYAVAALGVRALLVLGHSECGAVKAAMTTEEVPGQISALYSHIRPAVVRGGGTVSDVVTANARNQADLLRTSSTVIRDAARKASLKVAAGVYDLKTGKVALV